MIYFALEIYALVLLGGLIWRYLSIGHYWEPQDWYDEAKMTIHWVLWPLYTIAWILSLIAVVLAIRLARRQR